MLSTTPRKCPKTANADRGAFGDCQEFSTVTKMDHIRPKWTPFWSGQCLHPGLNAVIWAKMVAKFRVGHLRCEGRACRAGLWKAPQWFLPLAVAGSSFSENETRKLGIFQVASNVSFHCMASSKITQSWRKSGCGRRVSACGTQRAQRSKKFEISIEIENFDRE